MTSLRNLKVNHNLIENLPLSLNQLANLQKLSLSSNKLTFEDMMAIVNNPLIEIGYGYQATLHAPDTLYLGDTIKVEVDYSVDTSTVYTHNRYIWYKDGAMVFQDTSLAGRNYIPTEVGTYYYTITNPAASDLTLQSEEILVSVDIQSSLPCEFTSRYTDSLVLVDLYQATVGDNWDNNNGWLSSKPLEHWDGVETNQDGRVNGLNLDDRNLDGDLPPSTGNLCALEFFTLNKNSLTKIAPELGSLPLLSILSLSENMLNEVPSDLGKSSSLKDISIDNNQITNIPKELQNIPSLQASNISYNRTCLKFI